VTRAQLPWWANKVLRVDEADLRRLVEYMAEKTPAASAAVLERRLASCGLALEAGAPRVAGRGPYSSGSSYSVELGVPGLGPAEFRIVYVELAEQLYLHAELSSGVRLGSRGAGRYSEEEGCFVVTPRTLYGLYRFLYRELGVGAEPLAELAREAEGAGDRALASYLGAAYIALEAAADTVASLEEADYSGVVLRPSAEEVGRAVERALGLLREAREAVGRGDLERARQAVEAVLFSTPEHRVRLKDFVKHLTKHPSLVILEVSRASILRTSPGELVRTIDIYRALARASEAAGFKPKCQLAGELSGP